jgi:hypothetical protein
LLAIPEDWKKLIDIFHVLDPESPGRLVKGSQQEVVVYRKIRKNSAPFRDLGESMGHDGVCRESNDLLPLKFHGTAGR